MIKYNYKKFQEVIFAPDSDEAFFDGAMLRPFLEGDLPDEDSAAGHSIQPTVTCPNGQKIYKSTLVSLLNDDPKMSLER